MDLRQALLEVGHVFHHARGNDDVKILVGNLNILRGAVADIERDAETLSKLSSSLPRFVSRFYAVRVISVAY